MNKNNFAIAIYPTHTGAEGAIQELQKAGFEMKKLSIIGKDFENDEHVVGYYNAGDRIKVWGKNGAFWGGLWGLFFGSAFFWVPGLGPLLAAGPLVTWLVAALESAVVVGGLSALGSALYSLGIPKDSILIYESELKAGKYLLMAHGSLEDTDQARAILARTSPVTLEHHVQQHLDCQGV